MAKFNTVLEAIGRTPLVRLNRIAKDVPSQIWAKVEVAEAYRVLLSGASALLVTRRGSVAGIISRTDLIHHLVIRDDRNDLHEI